MRRLSSFAWRSLRARPLRSLLTALGIALGVGVLFASLAAGAAMDQAVDRAATADLGTATLRVTAVAESGFRPETVQTVANTPGVAAAAPAFIRRTYLAPTDQTATVGLSAPITVFGIDPPRESSMHDLSITVGTTLEGGLERSALISETLAREEKLSLGDDVTINGAAAPGPQTYKVIGLVSGDGPLPDASGRVVVLPIAAAQSLFASTGVTRIDVQARPGTNADVLVGQLEARITTEPYMLERYADIAESLRSSTGDFRASLLLVGALVLFVGAFLIFNTLSMTVSEQSREVALLRAAGTTRTQVIDLVLLQALALGLAGSVMGIAAGAALSFVAVAWLRSAGALVLDVAPFSIPSIVAAVAIGVLVTLAAALEPAWRASRIPPAEALRRRGDRRMANFARLRWLLVVFAALAGVAIVVWPMAAGSAIPETGSSSGVSTALSPTSDSIGSLLVYALLLGFVLAFPIVQRPFMALAGLPLRIFKSQERLARSSLARDPSRTALTAGALIVGLAMVVALATAAQSLRHVGTAWLTETIPGSELLTSIRPIPLSEPINQSLAAVPGVQSVAPVALFGVPLDGVREDAAAMSGEALRADGRLSFTANGGDRNAALAALDAGGSVILPRGLADQLGAHVGDTLSFAAGPAPTDLRVAGIVAHTVPGTAGEAILVGWTDAQTHFGVAGADFFAVRYSGDGGSAAAGAGAARTAIDKLAREFALEPSDVAGVGGTLGGALERVFRLLDALAIAAVLVAGLGVVNTLSMSVLERVREIAVLRAAGMTGRQVWGMVVIEAAVLGIAGALAGCVAGVAVGVLLTLSTASGFGIVLDPPIGALGFAFCFGILVTIVAAIYPARAASRISIVRALQYE